MVSFNIHGVPVSNGIAIGTSHLISNALLEVVRYDIKTKKIDFEVKRFKKALLTVKNELIRIKKRLLLDSNSQFAPFIDTHLMLLSDSNISDEPAQTIKDEK